MRSTGKPIIVSTGMSTLLEINAAITEIGTDNLLIAHSTSSYPCDPSELNLLMIPRLKEIYANIPIGYSGHEVGLAPTWAAVSLGASFVERHITLDRSMWGSDQAASVEIIGMHQLVRNIRDIERSFGDGIKKVYKSELSSIKRLRKTNISNMTVDIFN
jgi:N-acetylneuraminate synthase